MKKKNKMYRSLRNEILHYSVLMQLSLPLHNFDLGIHLVTSQENSCGSQTKKN